MSLQMRSNLTFFLVLKILLMINTSLNFLFLYKVLKTFKLKKVKSNFYKTHLVNFE